MVLDATECEIERPEDPTFQRLYYSGKVGYHTIKYEIAVEIESGEICWAAGGEPGSMADITLCRKYQIGSHLLPGEGILADKGYIGETYLRTPIKAPQTNAAKVVNHVIGTLREIVEHVFDRFKLFGCLSQRWRHDLQLHPLVFFVIAEIVNLDMKYRPMK
jgi:hypothetical protein